MELVALCTYSLRVVRSYLLRCLLLRYMKEEDPLLEEHPSRWSKLERIQFLLDSWDEIFDPNVTSPAEGTGDGTGIALMPKMARHPSVTELVRCLGLLSAKHRILYRHLKAYRCQAEWRLKDKPTLIRGPHGKIIPGEPVRERERITPSWINLLRVDAAEQIVAAYFQGEVFIPKELWDGLTKTA